MMRVTPWPPAAHTDTNPLPDPFSFNNLAMVAITRAGILPGERDPVVACNSYSA